MDNDPIRCFEGSAKPHEPFWTWIDQAETPTLEIDGVISEYSWFADDITPKLFKDQLYKYGKGGPVTMRLSSPGGDVIAAAKMRDIMTQYPGAITVQINGMAASAAVMVAISGKTVQISDSAYMMIHDPAVVVFLAQLDIETLGQLHDSLQSIKDGIIPAYAAKTGLSETRISNMMTKETWMSAREAVGFGFADSIIEAGQAPKKQITNLAYVNVLKSYHNAPKNFFTQQMQEADGMEDIAEACELAIDYCVECLHACETCPNAGDPAHQTALISLRQVIELGTICSHDCQDGELSMSQMMSSIQNCLNACSQCQTDARALAVACLDCAQEATLAADACQLCSSVCSTEAGTNLMNNGMSNQADIARARDLVSLRAQINLIKGEKHE